MRKQLRVLAGVCCLVMSIAATAHEGEDHSQDAKPSAPIAPSGGTPLGEAALRLSDGNLFVPKSVQRRLEIRTIVAHKSSLARTIELSGVVVSEPNAGGRVQATQTGRVEPGPRGIPVLGQRVQKGEVLGYLRAITDSFERGNSQAQLAEVAAQRQIAEKRVARLEQLDGLVPQKEIESARLELESLSKREDALGTALNRPEALIAPASGVIGAAQVVAGQLVDARDLLFEIIDPKRLAVEALAYDPGLAGNIKRATGVLSGGELKLAYLGGGRVLRDQAVPLLFRVSAATTALAVGQPLKVIAQTSQTVQGVSVPSAALVRDASGESLVWVHSEAERFAPRKIRYQTLDGQNVAVTEGLSGGERVVVSGSTVLAQVR